MVIGSQLFAPTLRPIVLSLLCGGLTSIVAKQFTGYGRVWTYLLIAEVWCVAALLYASAVTRALPLVVVASAVVGGFSGDRGVELGGGTGRESSRVRGIACGSCRLCSLMRRLPVRCRCVAFTLKSVQYDDPAENVDPCLVWLSRSLFLLAVVKMGLWGF